MTNVVLTIKTGDKHKPRHLPWQGYEYDSSNKGEVHDLSFVTDPALGVIAFSGSKSSGKLGKQSNQNRNSRCGTMSHSFQSLWAIRALMAANGNALIASLCPLCWTLPTVRNRCSRRAKQPFVHPAPRRQIRAASLIISGCRGGQVSSWLAICAEVLQQVNE